MLAETIGGESEIAREVSYGHARRREMRNDEGEGKGIVCAEPWQLSLFPGRFRRCWHFGRRISICRITRRRAASACAEIVLEVNTRAKSRAAVVPRERNE